MRAALLAPPAKAAVLNSTNSNLESCVNDFLSKNYRDLFIELIKPPPEDSQPPPPPPTQGTENSEFTSNRTFLLSNLSPTNELSEFLPPSEFVSEKDIYARKSDKKFVLSSGLNLMQTPDIPLVEDDLNLEESIKNLRCFVLPCGVFAALPRPKYSDNCYVGFVLLIFGKVYFNLFICWYYWKSLRFLRLVAVVSFTCHIQFTQIKE